MLQIYNFALIIRNLYIVPPKNYPKVDHDLTINIYCIWNLVNNL